MKTVVIILGPTCVGKTGAAICLAERLRTEIISSDSMQVYRGMDIGTGKPSVAERRGIMHHLIDAIGPSGDFSAGRYIKEAAPIIERLFSEGRIPIITGGTGLYIKAMTRGLFTGPSEDRGLREELLMREEDSPGTLYAELERLDPEAASRIMPGDIRRIIRAIEVCLKSESKMSVFQRERTEPLPYDFIKLGLARQRPELYAMIDRRVEEMMGRGLLDETKRLLMRNPSRTPMQAIGYKELAAHLRGEYSIEEAVRLIKRNTRRYAKRQFTWFKKEEGVIWTDITGIRSSEEIAGRLMKMLKETYVIIPHGQE